MIIIMSNTINLFRKKNREEELHKYDVIDNNPDMGYFKIKLKENNEKGN